MSISNEIQMVVLEVCNLYKIMISFHLIIQSISITGYAFVTFKNVEALKKVLAKQGHMIKGQKAFVPKAKPPAKRGDFRGGFLGRGKLRGSFRGRGGYSDRGGYNDRRGARGGFRGQGRARHHVQLVQNFY